MSKSIHTELILLLLLCLFSILFTGCSSNKIDEDIIALNEYFTRDVSSFEEVNLDEFDGVISVYCAKPVEWFMIENDETRYCFVITEHTKILNNKGKEVKHQMFNVGTNDVVEVKVNLQCGSLSKDYDDVDAWFVCDTVKVLDTLEY